MQEESAVKYDYSFCYRHLCVWWAIVASQVVMWLVILAVVVSVPKLWLYLGMVWDLSLVGGFGVVMHRRRLQNCRPIVIGERGVTSAPGSGEVQFISWSELQRVEGIPLAQLSSRRARPGLRLIASAGEIVVLGGIQGYDGLRSQIAERAAALGIPFAAATSSVR